MQDDDAQFQSTPVRILGVPYVHHRTRDGGDLYLTEYGEPFLPQLLPDNWLDEDWFRNRRQKLAGTSTVYRVPTRPVEDKSLDIVVKWCRVGEDIPFDTMTLNKFAQAEFNSPYEEFARVIEMRETPSHTSVYTHKPLGIYVPAERLKPWQTGRSETRMAHKKARHRDVELDVLRQYILIYEWIKGLSIVETLDSTDIPKEDQPALLAELTRRAIADLEVRGFRVLDMKPAHIIVRPQPDGKLLRDNAGDIAYALVDFELLERTPRRAEEVVRARRSEYLRKQRDRFTPASQAPFPEHLLPAEILGVSYVYGHAESTQGRLWVTGRDPELFDYFLPERWRRTRRVSLSKTGEVYYTRTKDNINIVWKVSRVGEHPDGPPDDPTLPARMQHGYNSPFEEFTLALELSRRRVNAVYPRAIYVTGLGSDAPPYIENNARFESHRDLRSPEGAPILRPAHNYITIWGLWNGLDELLANEDAVYCESINLHLACQSGFIPPAQHDELLALHQDRLLKAGMEDLNLKGEHILLSLTPDAALVEDADGIPEMRHCNFELVRRI